MHSTLRSSTIMADERSEERKLMQERIISTQKRPATNGDGDDPSDIQPRQSFRDALLKAASASSNLSTVEHSASDLALIEEIRRRIRTPSQRIPTAAVSLETVLQKLANVQLECPGKGDREPDPSSSHVLFDYLQKLAEVSCLPEVAASDLLESEFARLVVGMDNRETLTQEEEEGVAEMENSSARMREEERLEVDNTTSLSAALLSDRLT